MLSITSSVLEIMPVPLIIAPGKQVPTMPAFVTDDYPDPGGTIGTF